MINSSSSASKADSSEQKSDSGGLKLLGKKDLKCSLKTLFRSVQVFRNSGLYLSGDGLPGNQSGGLSMVVVTREKKQKSNICLKLTFDIFILILTEVFI